MSPARAALDAARNGKAAPSAKPAAAMMPPPWEEEKPQARANQLYESEPVQKKTETSVVQSVASEVPRAPTIQPLPALNWDGNWPALAAALNVRGVVQQLAQQSELIQCDSSDNVIQWKLRVPLETLCSAGSVDKLAAALTEHFGKAVRITTEIGAVQQTANAQAQAERALRQKQAEETMQSDPFVQTMMREFGATLVPGSIKPI
jgi:DNA polymerase-3 subunit gamma/tau